jgi:CMD domain protein
MTTPSFSATNGSLPGIAEPVNDLIDRLSGLVPGGATHVLRHRRDKVALATQGSYEGLLDPDLPGLTLEERLLVALYACRLSNAAAMAAHYRSCLETLSLRDERRSSALALVEAGVAADLSSLSDPRLRAILTFSRTLILKPVDGDKAALLAVSSAGVSTPAIVTLAQLIAFLSYQIRLVSGVAALQAAQQKRTSESVI